MRRMATYKDQWNEATSNVAGFRDGSGFGGETHHCLHHDPPFLAHLPGIVSLCTKRYSQMTCTTIPHMASSQKKYLNNCKKKNRVVFEHTPRDHRQGEEYHFPCQRIQAASLI